MRRWTAVVLTLVVAVPSAGQDERALRLRDAVAEALRHSPLLQRQEDAVAFAEIGEGVARSRFDLRITPALSFETGAGGLGYGRVGLDVSKRLPAGTDVAVRFDSARYDSLFADTRDAGYAVSIAQPLLRGLGPAATAEVTEAGRRVTTAARGRDEARRQLVLTVAEAYYAITRQQRLVRSGAQTLERARALHAQSVARTKVGLATELDVLRADLLVAQSESQLATQHELLDSAGDRFKVLLGRPLNAPLDVAADPPSAAVRDVPDDQVDLAALVAGALRVRLDVREAIDRVADTRRQMRIARWNLLPDLALQASYARRGLGSPSGAVLNDLLGGWRVGLVTAYGIDRAAQSATVLAADVGERAARRALVDLEQRVEAEVRQAYRARARAAAAVGIQTKALELAGRQLRLAQLRYRTGVAGNFDVIDAESSLFQAESALISAQVDRALADLILARVTGRLDPEDFQHD